MDSLVSVIIPAYNHEAFIEKALLSVYNQTYKNLELILIDDFSKDKTFELAKNLLDTPHFQKRFKRVICIKNDKNLGAHATLNKAITIAEGEYISLLNSDDLYHPYRIEKLLNYSNSSPYLFIFSNYKFINDKEEDISWHPLNIELQMAINDALIRYPSISFIFLQKQIALSTGNFLFTKKLYKKVGGFINLRYCHDLDFILQCIRYTEPIFVNEPLYYYRIHGDNTFSTVKDLAIAETEVCLTRYFKETEYGELVNNLAPCRKNYPLFFETFIKNHNLEDYYLRALTGYARVHRTVDKEIFRRVEL